MKKKKVSISRLVIIANLIVLAVLAAGMYAKLVELTSQITYLQDTTNIILSDVDGMESAITQTLQEENGMVEHYSIRVEDMNFAADTCDVSVYMIPKEYTDNTRISVYFGTNECPLEKDGYAYSGEITLPLEKSFDGNLTFLFADGKKKNTEVYSNYDGIQTFLDEVLSGSTEASPEYEDSILSVKGDAIYALAGKDRYEFEQFELVAEWNGRKVWRKDLIEAKTEDEPVRTGYAPEATEAVSRAVVKAPVDNMSGSAAFSFEYGPKEAGQLRLYLRAVTVEKYRFEYDLLRASLLEDGEAEGEPDGDGAEEDGGMRKLRLDEESVERGGSYIVYDRKGGKRVLQQLSAFSYCP